MLSAMNTDSLSTCSVDMIASSAARCQLASEVTISPYVVAQQGYAVAVRALEERTHYNQIECTDGVFRTIRQGDVIVGTLGERQALKGYSGSIPRSVEAGDTLHVLNLGGIIGECTSALPDLGPALKVEVLGAVMVDGETHWKHARIQDGALDPVGHLSASAPLVMVSGTAMNTGKTLAASRIVQGLTEQGKTVAAAKLTGASLKRDVRKMQEHGAVAVSTFTDAGVVCSTGADMAPVAKGIIQHLNAEDPDVIVLELGDGFIGYYGVDDILLDRNIQQYTAAHVVAATDLAGAWAAEQMFTERYRAPISVMTGPITDNEVGRGFIENRLGIPAYNARNQAGQLSQCVATAIDGDAPDEASASPTGSPTGVGGSLSGTDTSSMTGS